MTASGASPTESTVRGPGIVALRRDGAGMMAAMWVFVDSRCKGQVTREKTSAALIRCVVQAGTILPTNDAPQPINGPQASTSRVSMNLGNNLIGMLPPYFTRKKTNVELIVPLIMPTKSASPRTSGTISSTLVFFLVKYGDR